MNSFLVGFMRSVIIGLAFIGFLNDAYKSVLSVKTELFARKTSFWEKTGKKITKFK